MPAYASIDEFLAALPALARENADRLSGVTGCIALHVDGRPPVAFRLDASGECAPVDPATVRPDCAIHAGEADLLRMLSGNLSPVKAFMTGRVTVDGNAGKLLSLVKLLS